MATTRAAVSSVLCCRSSSSSLRSRIRLFVSSDCRYVSSTSPSLTTASSVFFCSSAAFSSAAACCSIRRSSSCRRISFWRASSNAAAWAALMRWFCTATRRRSAASSASNSRVSLISRRSARISGWSSPWLADMFFSLTRSGISLAFVLSGGISTSGARTGRGTTGSCGAGLTATGDRSSSCSAFSGLGMSLNAIISSAFGLTPSSIAARIDSISASMPDCSSRYASRSVSIVLSRSWWMFFASSPLNTSWLPSRNCLYVSSCSRSCTSSSSFASVMRSIVLRLVVSWLLATKSM